VILISEESFFRKIKAELENVNCNAVTGPGRSGAIASVYASHILRIPWIPFGQKCPEHLTPLLIIDTAEKTGKTIRKAKKEYNNLNTVAITLYKEPPRVYFWYEQPDR